MIDNCRNQMLNLYYLATLPQRRSSEKQRQRTGNVPVIAIFYHRVADCHPNDWSISWDLFRAQIEWLAERYEFVSLCEAQQRISAEENTRPTVTLTFDDGYAENCDHAIPWLLDGKIPFTYFVSTHHVQTGVPFEHDVERSCPLQPNSVDQIREMAQRGVEIGSHSRNHVDFAKIASPEELYDELVESKLELESLIDRPVRYFAFPYGQPDNMVPEAFQMAFQSGYWGVCSAYGGYNFPGSDSFHIRRIHGDPQWSRFKNWMTVDPRKVNSCRDFSPGNYRERF